jgi:DNA-binding transcriptional LysR family regulator
VLIANDPRSYRESIATVFRQLRPELRVEVAEPEALEDNLERFRPHVAISSTPPPAPPSAQVPVWVELYPGHAAHSMVYERERRTEFAEIQLQDLLSIVDRVARSD